MSKAGPERQGTSPLPGAEAPPVDNSAIRGYPLLLRRYRRLMEISRTLSSTLELPTLLGRIILAACEVTDTEAASILLVDPRSGELRLEASTRVETMQPDSTVVRTEGTIAGWIATHNEPLTIADVAQDPRRFRPLGEKIAFDARSLLGVPLITRNRTIGVLEAINKKGDGAFTSDDVDAMVTLAAQAAVAIETVRLFQQSDLISDMVHELRTPLASLTATSYMLLRPDLLDEQRNEFIRTIQQETMRLTNMTSDFLDLARLETGRARFSRDSFQMSELAIECMGIVQPQARERGIACALELPPGVPSCPPVSGDRAKIKQVLLNLLTNAIKYNREGGTITVRGSWSATAQRFEVVVADTGRGIPPESLPHVFDRFYRAADDDSWTPGTGLGLAIAKKIVDTHGGELAVESEVGIGTTFKFALPLAS